MTSGDFASSDAYGIVGTTGLFVTISEKADSIVTGDRAKDRVLIAMLRALGEQADSTEPQPKVLLPEFCPAVDSPQRGGRPRPRSTSPGAATTESGTSGASTATSAPAPTCGWRPTTSPTSTS